MGHSSRRRPGGALAALEEVNLVPILSILVVLVPMLIFAFTFFEVTVVSIAAPRLGPPPEKKQAEAATVRVVLRSDGFEAAFTAGAADGRASDETIHIAKRPVAGRAEGLRPDYDWPALYDRLAAWKALAPQLEELRVGADPDVRWQAIARTIDCARVQLDGAPFVGDDALARFERARPIRDGETPRALFEKVVFVVAP